MIEPLKDNVVVKPIKKTPEGVALLERSRDAFDFGIVWLVGPDVEVLKPDDLVLLPTWNEDILIVDSVEYTIITEKSVSVRIV